MKSRIRTERASASVVRASRWPATWPELETSSSSLARGPRRGQVSNLLIDLSTANWDVPLCSRRSTTTLWLPPTARASALTELLARAGYRLPHSLDRLTPPPAGTGIVFSQPRS